MASLGKHSKHLSLSLLFSNLLGAAVRHAGDQSCGEFIESGVLAQKGVELLHRAKLRSKDESRPGLGPEEMLETAVDGPQDAGIVLGSFHRDFKWDGRFGGREQVGLVIAVVSFMNQGGG